VAAHAPLASNPFFTRVPSLDGLYFETPHRLKVARPIDARLSSSRAALGPSGPCMRTGATLAARTRSAPPIPAGLFADTDVVTAPDKVEGALGLVRSDA